MRFLSDNAAAVCPEVMAALADANIATERAYDGDPWSERLDGVFSDFFGAPARVFAVGSGTAANALSLSVLVPPFGAVVCHREAHVEVDECGAPEFFTGGAKLILCEGEDAKLTPETVDAGLAAMRGDVHQVQVRALTLTQANEYGCVYSPEEVAALAGHAKSRGWRVHMDGARFANALVHLGCHPGEVTWRAGVDILSFGAIKNGGMGAEAIVVFDPALAEDLPFRRKRAGQMPSKGRFRAAELIAMIESGAWARNAGQANAGARRLAEAAGARLTHPVQANEVFVNLGGAGDRLRAQGFSFYDWGAAGSGEARFVVPWDHDAADIEALAAALGAL